MAKRNISKTILVTRHHGAEAAGVTTITPSAGIDMQGYRTCMFVVAFGAIVSGAATSIEVHTSSDDGAGDSFTALLGSGVTVADDDDNTYVTIEINTPIERYLKLIVNRATQNSTVDGIIAIQGGGRSAPQTNVGELHIGPAEGAA